MDVIGVDPQTLDFVKQWESGAEYFAAHTSGSTGEPKEILLPRSDMLRSAKSTCDYFKLSSGSTIVSPLSASYIAGKMMIVRAIVADCRLVMEPPSNRPLSKPYGDIDLLPIVPSQAEWLLTGDLKGNRVKNVIVGGAPVSPLLERRLASASFNCVATYGMTETCSHVALKPMGQPYFEAMPGVTFDTDSDRRLIICAGGYSFDRLVTNDLVELVDDRRFRWLGRKDNVIISGGVKLHPEEIERELAELIDKPFYLIGRPDDKWGTAMVMYIEDNDREIDADKLKSRIKTIVHPYKVPHEIRLCPMFQRTASGKIKRVLL